MDNEYIFSKLIFMTNHRMNMKIEINSESFFKSPKTIETTFQYTVHHVINLK